MDCGLLRRMARGSGSSTRGRRSLKFSLKQQLGSMKRRSEEQHAAETDRDWPADASRYQLLGVAGRGAHAVVRSASSSRSSRLAQACKLRPASTAAMWQAM